MYKINLSGFSCIFCLKVIWKFEYRIHLCQYSHLCSYPNNKINYPLSCLFLSKLLLILNKTFYFLHIFVYYFSLKFLDLFFSDHQRNVYRHKSE